MKSRVSACAADIAMAMARTPMPQPHGSEWQSLPQVRFRGMAKPSLGEVQRDGNTFPR